MCFRAGYTFETICYKHLGIIRKALHIPDGAQIDLIIDRDDEVITICEIKHTAGMFEITKDYKNNLLNKVAVFKKITRTRKQIFLAMITNHGIKENSYAAEYINASIALDGLI